jgi:two-component system sensor histidine kinase DegS
MGDLRLLLDALPVAASVFRASDGRVLFVNQYIERLFGAGGKEIVGRDASYFFPQLRDRRTLNKLRSRNGGVNGVEVQSRRHDGTPLKLLVWQRRKVCAGRECVLAIMIDVTHHRTAERHLRERQTSLEQLLALNERERGLIAFEIHDGFVQDMVGTLLHLEASRREVQKSGGPGLRELDMAIESLRDGVREARRLIAGVRLPDLAAAGLIGAVRSLAHKISEASPVEVEFRAHASFPRLDANAETLIYRIIQEGLTNVRRHSKAERACVELNCANGFVEIVVQDWGNGFDPAEIDEDQFGLQGIRHRARLLDGEVHIQSSHGEGSSLRVSIPVDRATSPSAPAGPVSKDTPPR